MDLHALRTYYERQKGYSRLNATARACQDVILAKLATSSMRDHVTVKGGILMCAMSGSNRRATRDIDLDFLRYPLTDEDIRSFISALSHAGDNVILHIKGPIEELSQLDYQGRRVTLVLNDGRSKFETKLDLGVHTSVLMKQDTLWFDVGKTEDSICLLANSKEQVFTEKLKSLLRHSIRSTRFRDLYDMYYIGHRSDLDRRKLALFIGDAIIDDPDMWDTDMKGIVARVKRTLSNRQFLSRMKSSHRDWVGVSADEVAQWLPRFLQDL